MLLSKKGHTEVPFLSKNPTEKPVLIIGGILLIFLSTVLLVETHIKTTHLFKIESLSKIRQEVTDEHLSVEDSLGSNYYTSTFKIQFSESKKVLNVLLAPKDWGDYIIPLYNSNQLHRLKIIKENLLKFDTLLRQDKAHLDSLQHDIVFNNIIKQINSLHSELTSSLSKQLKFLMKIQILILILIALYITLVIYNTSLFRKKRKVFLIQQETLLKNLKQNNYFLEESQKISKLGYYTYDFKTKVWIASQTILDILNFKKPKASIQLWFDIVHLDDLYILKNQLEKRQKDNKSDFDITYRVISPKDNMVLWINHVAAPLKTDISGNLLPVLGIIQDISAQKEAELNLIKTNEIAQLGAFSLDLISRKITRSKLFNKIVEFHDDDEITVGDWCEITHPDDLLSNRELLQKCIETKKDFSNDFRIFTKINHKLKWLEGHGEIIFNNNIATKLVGTFIDITKRKLAEIASIKNEAMLNQAQKIAKVGSYNLDFNLQKGSISKEYSAITGFVNRNEISFDEWRSLVHPDDVDGNEKMLKKSIEEGLAFDREFRIYPLGCKTYKWIHGKGKIFFKNNKLSNFIGTIQDITNSKFNALKLSDITNKLQMAHKIAQIGVLTFDFSISYFESTKIFDTIAGIPDNYKKDFKGWLNLIYPEDLKNLQELGIDNSVIKTKAIEFRIIRPIDKKIIWVVGYGKKEFDHNNKFVNFIGTIQDITEKRRQELLNQTIFDITKMANEQADLDKFFDYTRQKLGELINTTNFYIALSDKQNKNFTLKYISGIDSNLKGKTFPLGKSLTAHVINTKSAVFINENQFYELTSKELVERIGNPAKCWIGVPLASQDWIYGVMAVQDYNNSAAYKKEDVELLEFVAHQLSQVIQRRISKDKILEAATILNKLSTIVLVVDENGDITYASPSIKQALDYEPEVMLGQGWWEITFEDQKRAKKIKKAVLDHFFKDKSLNLNISERRLLTKEGVQKWFQWYVSRGVGDTYISIGVDITEKRKLEHDFLHAFINAQEQEKQSFGEELHDGMSQILAAENMYIETLLKINKDKTDASYKHLLTLKDLNVSAMEEARNIAHGLMSKQLKEKGLLEAVAHICSSYSHSKNIKFKFEKHSIDEKEIAKEIKTNLFRLTQEISTNIIRHSGALLANISIKKIPTNTLELIIKDNGVGMDLEKMKRENKGAGLKNIERRVKLLNGTIKLETAPNLGACYTITVPLDLN